jgi:hypothetical protein
MVAGRVASAVGRVRWLRGGRCRSCCEPGHARRPRPRPCRCRASGSGQALDRGPGRWPAPRLPPAPGRSPWPTRSAMRRRRHAPPPGRRRAAAGGGHGSRRPARPPARRSRRRPGPAPRCRRAWRSRHRPDSGPAAGGTPRASLIGAILPTFEPLLSSATPATAPLLVSAANCTMSAGRTPPSAIFTSRATPACNSAAKQSTSRPQATRGGRPGSSTAS